MYHEDRELAHNTGDKNGLPIYLFNEECNEENP